ncbi:DNA-binding protein [Virgibacillus halophilus]|uniref:DNA-binding protein n=1 Tax=Tigheibacillus halophilus TaxID=361280 RepID=A0ABU5C8U0_9BACI|nr:DNA-binding protein [Virgibacillus halophilus]
MTPNEAAYTWGINQETVKNKLKPSIVGQDTLDEMIRKGLIKYFLHPNGKRKEWILSIEAMEKWFGKKRSQGSE